MIIFAVSFATMNYQIKSKVYKRHFAALIRCLLTAYCSIQTSFSFAQIPLVPYRIGENWGYADTSGHLKIQPFCRVMPHAFNNDGLAIFPSETGNYGVVDTTGKVIVPSIFTEVEINYPYFVFGRNSLVGSADGTQLKIEDKDRSYYQNLLFYFDGSLVFPFHIEDIVFNNNSNSNHIFIVQENNILLYKVDWNFRKSQLIKKYRNAAFSNFTYEEDGYFSDKINGFTLVYTDNDGNSKFISYQLNGHRKDKSNHQTRWSKLKLRHSPSDEYFNGKGAKTTAETDNYGESPVSNSLSDEGYMVPDYLTGEIEPTGVISVENKKYTLDPNPKSKNAKFYDLIVPVFSRPNYYLYKNNHLCGLVLKNGIDWIDPIWDTIIPCDFISKAPMKGLGNFMFLQWLVRKNGKWGVQCPESPKFNITAQYDSIIPENYYHYLVRQNGFWGAISDTGKFEIPCRVDLSYTGLYKLPLLTWEKTIVMVGKVGNGYKLFSNCDLRDTTVYDNVEVNERFKNDFLTIYKNGLRGKVFEWRGRIYVLPTKYTAIYASNNDLQYGDSKFIFVRLPDGNEGYVRQDGKEFFEP